MEQWADDHASQARLVAFFWFCVRVDWAEKNPALLKKRVRGLNRNNPSIFRGGIRCSRRRQRWPSDLRQLPESSRTRKNWGRIPSAAPFLFEQFSNFGEEILTAVGCNHEFSSHPWRNH